MIKSTTPIIDHIPLFLIYCKENGYSNHTQANYKMYLQKFTLWLQNNKKQNLRPHELAPDDILAYKAYLVGSGHYKGGSLKPVTQHYYLIALRALLSYFIVRDIESLLPARITLPRANKSEKTVALPNLDQIEQLLLYPDIKTTAGLRDRAILETIISTGLKVNQIVNLDLNKLPEIPEEVTFWINKYLKTRKDRNRALFINYNSKKESLGGRLTARSIERIVQYYGKKIRLPFLITPEILRWVRPRAIFGKETKIQAVHNHKTLSIKNYNHQNINSKEEYTTNQSLAWDNIENLIEREELWLKSNIPVLPERYRENHYPPFFRCDNCIFRKIAILIVGGQIKARELQSTDSNDLWNNLTKKSTMKISRHGQGWHKKMMDVICDYFKVDGNEIIMEPSLNYGRADLAVHSKNIKNIYIEVDTVSLFKLWYNLSVMKNATFLIIPSENKIIEFNTL